MDEIMKAYDPSKVEGKRYQEWVDKGYFHSEPDKTKKPFTIVMPPPNITGQLHMGHALDNTLQDILTRFRRMQGYCTLWLPGTDHASIATEVKIVEAMAKEGLTKKDVGREGFLERAWEWRAQYGGRIVEQLKKLGSSCDWQRERFTMDEGCNKAVTRVFLHLYEKGLIYRGDRIINWCPCCKTALSDAEVEYEEKQSHLWHIRYDTEDGTGSIVVATTRPETMLGDTAVAVNPEDERYAHLIGKNVILPLVNKPIPVVADEYVDKEFGTGAVKITPAHDPNDFEVATRHQLPVLRVMDYAGYMNTAAGKYVGLERFEARKQIVTALQENGHLVRIEDYNHNVGECYRCSTVVEPIISKQWFVRMQPLADPAIKAVREDETRFIPDRFARTYYNWMENIRDWCISRQLWWGHRIPAYYCDACEEMVVSATAPDRCPKCGGAMRQDEDVLDTWFSSALWPFSTLGWPEETEELKYFYPTSVLVTAYDIIFFWVARMIFSGIEHMGQPPFAHVFIHGLVRDAQGRKMSKSLGNGIDPLEIIEQYGADALRFSLSTGVSPGNDLRFSQEKVESARNFTNKLWNAFRFVLMNVEQAGEIEDITNIELDIADKWILARLNSLIGEVTANLDNYELGLAAQKLYDFTWSEFCDWYIEMSKTRLYGTEEAPKRAAQAVLVYVLRNILQLLHPIIPFITEEIWQQLPGTEGSIMMSAWPEQKAAQSFPAEEQAMNRIMEMIKSVRNLRAEMNVPPSKRTKLYLMTQYPDDLNAARGYLEKLAYATETEIISTKEQAPAHSVSALTEAAVVYIPMGELIDLNKEIERLRKERTALKNELQRSAGKLANESFVAKAPPAVVEEERAKQEKRKDLLAKTDERIAALEEMQGK